MLIRYKISAISIHRKLFTYFVINRLFCVMCHWISSVTYLHNMDWKIITLGVLFKTKMSAYCCHDDIAIKPFGVLCYSIVESFLFWLLISANAKVKTCFVRFPRNWFNIFCSTIEIAPCNISKTCTNHPNTLYNILQILN